MPSCVIKWCKNNTKANKKSEGISFHTFPTNVVIREEWAAAVRVSRNEPQWQPSSSSVVCSDHFEKSDMYDTKRGLRRIHREGYPKKKLVPHSNADISHYSSLSSTSSTTAHKLVPPSNADICHDSSLSSTSSATAHELVPLLSADICYDSSLSSTSSATANDLPVSPNRVIDSSCVILPSTSFATAHDLPVSPNKTMDSSYVVLPSTSSCACALDLPDKAKANDDQIFDSPRKYKLRKKLKIQEKIIEKKNKKIKYLQQRVRRLKNRNLALKNIITNIKKN